MSKRVLERLRAQFGERIVETTEFRGDEAVIVEPASWVEVARFVKSDPACACNHFSDMTAVDYPEREPDLPRFDVVLHVRSMEHRHRLRLKTRVADGEALPTLIPVWAGANWAEREIWDMFGIRFEGHPDLRRILLYEEFVGHPLRKDYPIDRTPFGQDEGQPWTRINWAARLQNADRQVSPAIALQQGQRRALSESSSEERGAEVEE
jgi:NADH-quinone oxidoreductase subunit C